MNFSVVTKVEEKISEKAQPTIGKIRFRGIFGDGQDCDMGVVGAPLRNPGGWVIFMKVNIEISKLNS